MAGHSKWAQIKRQKAANDAKRGQLYTKLGREITVAARDGGGDPETNFRLRLAIQRAKDANMSADTIERAVKRGSGELDDAARLEDINYEGYGPGGAALFIEALTDNRNRTVAELRNVLARGGGNLGESGSVAWMFDTRGQIIVELNDDDPDEAMLESIELGADDVQEEDGTLVVITLIEQLEAVRRGMEECGYTVESAELTRVPKTMSEPETDKATQAMRLIERVEDLDDVQKVYTNLELTEEVMVAFSTKSAYTS
jgi:YebC/PmpR family DNA-binding regulatory protein